jgi:hypothetical protein
MLNFSAGGFVGNRFRALLLLIAALPLLARRAPGPYDANQLVTVKGIVTRVEWTSPRIHLYLNVQEPSGEVHEWGVEIDNGVLIKRYGWTRNTVKPGDAIACTGRPAKAGARLMRATVVELAGGAKLRLPS